MRRSHRKSGKAWRTNGRTVREARCCTVCSMLLNASCCQGSTAAAIASGRIIISRRDEGGGDALMYVRLYRAIDTCAHEQSWAAHGSTYDTGTPMEASR